MNINDTNINCCKINAHSAAELLKALASDRRLLILCELSAGEKTVSDLVARTGLRQAALSQHLARLRRDGLVAARREAPCTYYSLADKAVSAVIGALAGLYCRVPATQGEKLDVH